MWIIKRVEHNRVKQMVCSLDLKLRERNINSAFNSMSTVNITIYQPPNTIRLVSRTTLMSFNVDLESVLLVACRNVYGTIDITTKAREIV